MHQLHVLLLVLSVFFIILIEYSDAGGKKGQQIIMSGGGLVFKDEKKKKGDTIIIKDSCPSCSCGGKKIKHMPIPIMMAAPAPQKEIKVVHVPQKEVKVIHVPVHHHDSWGHGYGDMHEASFHGGWAARADEHEQMFEDAAPRSLGIGEKPMPSPDNVGYDFEDDPTQYSGVPMTGGMVQNDFMPDYSD